MNLETKTDMLFSDKPSVFKRYQKACLSEVICLKTTCLFYMEKPALWQVILPILIKDLEISHRLVSVSKTTCSCVSTGLQPLNNKIKWMSQNWIKST